MINPDDYWVNNPLITPINKALMYDNAIWNAEEHKRYDIIELLEDRIKMVRKQGSWGIITAMGRPVEPDDAIAITEAIIYAIREEVK